MNDVAYYTMWEELEKEWLESCRFTKEQREQEVLWWKENRKIIYQNLERWRDELDKLSSYMMNFIQTGEYEGQVVPFRLRKSVAPLVEFLVYRFQRKTLEHRIEECKRILAAIGSRENVTEKVDIDDIKRIPIRYVLNRYGIELKPGAFIYSPFHQEKTASCKIYENSNSFYDYSSGKGGSVIDLIMGIENCDTKKAIEILSGM